MSGLLALLQQSAMSLQAQQSYSSTVAHNLSNSNTPGYSRQRAEISAAAPAERFGNSFIGRGAMLMAVSQARDRFLEAQMPGSISQEMASGTEAQTLESVSTLDLDNSIAPALSNFYSGLRALAQNPGSSNYREAAVGAATQLALSFNRSSQAIEASRSGVDAKMEARLPEINESLAQIARLNVQVRQARNGGAEPNDLLDTRQRLTDRMSELLGAVPVANKEGDMNLTLSDGTSLVASEKAAVLSVLPDATNSGHAQIYIQKPDGSPRQPYSGTPGGEFGGMLAARDGAMKHASEQIDQLAFDLAGSINTIAQTGVALDGSTGRDLFTGITTVSGAARSMTMNAAIASNTSLFPAGSTSAPGNSNAVQGMIDTEAVALSGGTNAAGALARITADFGASAQRASTMHEGDAAMLTQLDSMRQSASGVSVDEELVNMQQAQRAYEAVSRVIKTADSMLETLLSLK